jgi:PKD repeat protein
MYRLLFLVAALVANSFADTIPGNSFVDFEIGNDGSTITAATMTDSTHGNVWNGWQSLSNPSAQTVGATPNLKISTAASYQLYTPADINGTIYSGSGTRGMRATLSADNAVQVKLPSPGYMLSVGFYFRFNGSQINSSPRDVVGLRSDPTGNYQFLQIYDGPTPYFHAHWQPGGSGIGNNVNFNRNQWYWVTMNHVRGGGTMKVSFYDPAKNYSLVGTSTGAVSSGTQGCTTIQFGAIKYSSGGSQSLDFDNFIINTNGVFPLGPGNGSGGPINQSPTAVATANPISGTVPLAVSFSGSSSSDPEGGILTYNWDFGDGTSSNAANPSHTYQSAGSYIAKLTVSDGVNNSTSSPINITVSAVGVNQPPSAQATASVTNGIAPLNVVFSSNGSSDPEGKTITYSWTFGDGTTSSAANPSHSYPNPGSYTVRLSVSDGNSSTSSSPIGIKVLAAGSGLVAAYSFDEQSGSEVIDSSGSGNTGSVVGATLNSTGKYGRALSFNGATDFISVPDSTSFHATAGLTIEAWVLPASVSNGWMPIVFKPYDSSQISFVLQGATPQGGVPCLFVSGASENSWGTSPLPLNTWSHLAGTYDGNTMRLYVNGVLTGTQAQSGGLTYSSQPLTIGGNDTFQAFWQGSIDEVRIYNRALELSEIQHDMNTPVVSLPAAPQNIRVVGP